MEREKIFKLIQCNGSFTVHKYKQSHTNLRRITKRMLKEGLLTLIGLVNNEYVYVIKK